MERIEEWSSSSTDFPRIRSWLQRCTLVTRLAHIPAWLRRFEARSYALARRPPPDLVIKLQTTPEVIMTREPDMDPLVIRRRTSALQQLSFRNSAVLSVDAGQPLADVIRAAKAEIWRRL